MDAINTSVLCGISNTTGNFVLKAGDTMTGSLLMPSGQSFRSGLPVDADIIPPTSSFAGFFGSSNANQIICRYSNDAIGPSFYTFKTRRTTDSSADALVANGDAMFTLTCLGSNGATYNTAAQIVLQIDTTPGLNDMPGSINLLTTLDGTSTALSRWIVKNDGLFTGTRSILANNNTAIPAGGTAGVGYVFSATANFGAFFGSGIPALSASQGSLYLRSDGGSSITRAYINTNGTTGWTPLTTVA